MEHPQKNGSLHFLLLPHINPYHKKLEGETWNKAMQVDITDIRRNNQDSFVVVHWFGRMNCVLIAGSKLLFLLWIQQWWVRKPSIFKPFPTTNPIKAENRLASCLENHNLKSAKLRTFRTDNPFKTICLDLQLLKDSNTFCNINMHIRTGLWSTTATAGTTQACPP